MTGRRIAPKDLTSIFRERRMLGKPPLQPIESAYLFLPGNEDHGSQVTELAAALNAACMTAVTICVYNAPRILSVKCTLPSYVAIDEMSDLHDREIEECLRILQGSLEAYYTSWGIPLTQVPKTFPRQYSEYVHSLDGMVDPTFPRLARVARMLMFPSMSHLLLEFGHVPGSRMKLLRACDLSQGSTTKTYVDTLNDTVADPNYDEIKAYTSNVQGNMQQEKLMHIVHTVKRTAEAKNIPSERGAVYFVRDEPNGIFLDSVCLTRPDHDPAVNTELYRKNTVMAGSVEFGISRDRLKTLSTVDQMAMTAADMLRNAKMNPNGFVFLSDTDLPTFFDHHYFSGGNGIILYDNEYELKGIYNMDTLLTGNKTYT